MSKRLQYERIIAMTPLTDIEKTRLRRRSNSLFTGTASLKNIMSIRSLIHSAHFVSQIYEYSDLDHLPLDLDRGYM